MIPKKYLQQTRQINWIFFKLYKEFLQFYEKNMQATKEKWQMTQKEQLELVNKYMRIHTLLSGPLYFASKHTLPKCPTWLLNSLFQVFDQRSTSHSQSFLWLLTWKSQILIHEWTSPFLLHFLPGTVNSLRIVSSSCKNPALCGQEFYSHSLPYPQCLEQYLVCSQNLYILAEWKTQTYL